MITKHIAIMLTDIKGFASKTSSSSRSETMELLKTHKELVLPIIEKHAGHVVKTIGDAFLVTFESPTNAVLCGVEIQNKLKSYNAEKSDSERIDIRIAINSGEVTISEDGDIFGEAVNITSRLETIAEVGQVFFTESIYLAMNKKEVPSSEIGYRQFKGVPEKVKVYRVLREMPVGVGSEKLMKAGEVTNEITTSYSKVPFVAATFGRRSAAIILDFIIFSIILSVLGIKDLEKNIRLNHAKNEITKAKDSSHVEIISSNKAKKINIDDSGIKLEDANGDKVIIGKDGISVKKKETKGTEKFKKISIPSSYDKENDEKFYWEETKKFPLKFLLWFIYCGVMVWRFSATLGKMIMKIKVVDEKGEKPSADKAFLRSLVSLLSLGAIGLGYLWALGKEKQTWHDILSKTKVVKSV